MARKNIKCLKTFYLCITSTLVNGFTRLGVEPGGVLKMDRMANSDIVKKKPVALDVSTYERLSKLAAQLRIDNPGGGFVSMSVAVWVLLDHWNKSERVEYNSIVQAYIDLPSASQPVVIKDGNNQYVNNATVATTNLFLTNYRPDAKVFDNSDQAKAFLRQCGRVIEGWIIEPA